ncbi:MAG: UDP-2,3-diacylglucosamine diphosphatase LpxI [Verrucomicrobiota bacterium]
MNSSSTRNAATPLNLASLGIIAGNGAYPLTLAKCARAAGVERIVVTAFDNETDPALAGLVDEIEWMRVGQLGRMIRFFSSRNVGQVIMAGQIAPGNLFDLRPDVKALIMLAKLRQRNAESIFGAIGDELARSGVELLPATTFMEQHLAGVGVFAGPRLSRREEEDVRYGFGIAKEVSRLDIGQTVVVKGGTVLAVEGFDGTNATIRRGGQLGRKDAVVVKVSKPNQDLRFDVPVIGPATLENAAEAQIRVLAVETGLTLVLDGERVAEMAARLKISVMGIAPSGA